MTNQNTSSNTKTITDVIVHTRNHIDDNQFEDIRRRINTNDGVVSVSRNSKTPHLLMVVYNAARIRSDKILQAFTRQGYDASLVGM
jgi:hypothetical protein